eukprot:m51a1_g7269 hypothetical protein (260) ;mRNA; r:212630-213409
MAQQRQRRVHVAFLSECTGFPPEDLLLDALHSRFAVTESYTAPDLAAALAASPPPSAVFLVDAAAPDATSSHAALRSLVADAGGAVVACGSLAARPDDVSRLLGAVFGVTWRCVAAAPSPALLNPSSDLARFRTGLAASFEAPWSAVVAGLPGDDVACVYGAADGGAGAAVAFGRVGRGHVGFCGDAQFAAPESIEALVAMCEAAGDVEQGRGHVARGPCAVCGQESTARCAGCKRVFYCGQEHQRADWPAHRAVCSRP